DPRNFNQRVSLGRNDLLIRTFPNKKFDLPEAFAPYKPALLRTCCPLGLVKIWEALWLLFPDASKVSTLRSLNDLKFSMVKDKIICTSFLVAIFP
ncbi:hypothetical protein ACJEP9_25305, partial [Klebsiella pneumoniae]